MHSGLSCASAPLRQQPRAAQTIPRDHALAAAAIAALLTVRWPPHARAPMQLGAQLCHNIAITTVTLSPKPTCCWLASTSPLAGSITADDCNLLSPRVSPAIRLFVSRVKAYRQRHAQSTTVGLCGAAACASALRSLLDCSPTAARLSRRLTHEISLPRNRHGQQRPDKNLLATHSPFEINTTTLPHLSRWQVESKTASGFYYALCLCFLLHLRPLGDSSLVTVDIPATQRLRPATCPLCPPRSNLAVLSQPCKHSTPGPILTHNSCKLSLDISTSLSLSPLDSFSCSRLGRLSSPRCSLSLPAPPLDIPLPTTMFSPAYTRPPKPPGTRRAGLRSTDGQAPPLPSKHDLFKPATTSSTKGSSPLVPKSAKGKVKAASPLKESTAAGDDDHDDQAAASDDSDATHVSPHNNTRAPRPLSLISESSAPMVSPPPPYGYRRTSTASPLADVKRPLVHNVPPPPEPLESGPSSVRTSMISVDHVDLALEVDEDDDEPGNTLTLRGVQRLIKQQELGTSSCARRSHTKK